MKSRYKDRNMQRIYESMLSLAADSTSELYYKGKPQRGAGHRAAFWDGYSGKFTFSGPKRSAHVIPGTLSAACFMAGKEFARLTHEHTRVDNPGQLVPVDLVPVGEEYREIPMTNTIALLPCPFCGSPAKMEYEDPGMDRAPSRYFPRCTKCWAHTTPVETSTWSSAKGHQGVPDAEAQAARLWNTRHTPAPEQKT